MLTNSKIITREELTKLLNVHPATMRMWLSGYRFTKFEYLIRSKKAYYFNEDFINTFADFLELKRLPDLAKILKDFYKKNSCK